MNVPNAPGPAHSEWLKQYILSCLFYQNFFKCKKQNKTQKVDSKGVGWALTICLTASIAPHHRDTPRTHNSPCQTPPAPAAEPINVCHRRGLQRRPPSSAPAQPVTGLWPAGQSSSVAMAVAVGYGPWAGPSWVGAVAGCAPTGILLPGKGSVGS